MSSAERDLSMMDAVSRTQWSKPSMGSFYVLCVVMIAAGYLRTVQSAMQIPITAAMIAAGFTTGLFLNSYAVHLLHDTVLQFADLNMNRFNVLFLPTLVYTVTIFLKREIFWKSFFHSLLLGVLGLGMCSVIQALVVYLQDNSCTATEAIMLGLISSYQEPIFARDINLLMSVKSHVLETLAVAESLVGTSVFAFVYSIYTSGIYSFLGAMIAFFANFVGGFLFGQISGTTLAYLLLRRSKEAQITIITAFVFVYFTFHIAQMMISGSGVVAVVSMGLTASAGENESIASFWVSLRLVLGSTMTFLASVKMGREVSHSATHIEIMDILIAYTTRVSSRLVMVTVLFPVLAHTGYRLSWRQALVLAWLSHKSTLMVSLNLTPLFQSNGGRSAVELGVRKLGVTFLINAFNCTLIPFILDKLGVQADVCTDAPHIRRARRVIRNALEKSRRLQRQNGVFSGANWLWVYNATKLPYTELGQHRVQQNSEPLEGLKHIMDDMRQHIMRIQKMSFMKQYREGMIQKKTHIQLASIMQHPIERGVCLDINTMRSTVRPQAYIHLLKKLLGKIRPSQASQTESFSEMEGRRRRRPSSLVNFFVKVTRGPGPVLCSSLVSAGFLFILHSDSSMRDSVPQWFSQTFSICLEGLYFMVFTVELWCQMRANGIRGMWESPSVRLDCLLYSLYLIEYCFAVITDMMGNPAHLFHGFTITFLSIILFMRIIKLLQNWKDVYRELFRIADTTIDGKLIRKYDIGWAFIKAEDEVMCTAGRIAGGGPTTAGIIRNRAAAEKLAILKEVTVLQQKYPSLEVATKSRQAARRILNDARCGLQDLREGGLIDHDQYNVISKNLNKMVAGLDKMPEGVTTDNSLRCILMRVPWIPKRNLRYFCQRCPVVHFQKGSVIIEKNHLARDVYVLCTGVVKIQGLADESSMREKIANSDSTHFYTGSGTFTDYMDVPNTIGLLGFLNRTSSVCEVSCETDVDLCRISFDVLQTVIEAPCEPPGLLYRMWQTVAVRIGLNLLVHHKRYMDWTHDHIKHFLESGTMPDLLQAFHFTLDPSVVDLLLIQGLLSDEKAQICYQGPAYIPEHVREIVFLGTVGVRPRPVVLMTTATNILLPPHYDWYNKRNQPVRYNQSSFSSQETRSYLYSS
ncbi:sperm-specific sodium:proton exchanger-like [Ornithodoros turicata]|uniref:sperm-specific sodium:proton exchanger-like n=1 Tax=Ornithodoros turicata TaxID=34597 RepID=UPI003138E106